MSAPKRDGDALRSRIGPRFSAPATAESATHGYAGGRIDRIFKKAGTNLRMIYELFGSKSELDIATLESALSALRTENLTKTSFMKKSPRINEMSSPVLSMTKRLLARGITEASWPPISIP